MRRRNGIKLTDQKVVSALAEMGVTQEKLQAVRDATSQEAGDKLLTELKALCKKGYREAALKLHPDHNEGDPKQAEKAEKFKWYKTVYEGFLEAKFRYRPVMPQQPFRVFRDSGTSTGTTTGTTTTTFTGSMGGWNPFYDTMIEQARAKMRQRAREREESLRETLRRLQQEEEERRRRTAEILRKERERQKEVLEQQRKRRQEALHRERQDRRARKRAAQKAAEEAQRKEPVSPKARELFTQDAHQVAPDDIFGEARTNVGSPPPFDPDQEFKEMVDGIRQQLWGSK